ncbi:hypothetical protein SEA_SLOOPYJOE_80 [Arthrobacter phage Sloopyjoe]|nr:hypothetical protein PBI_STAYER_80 [Arthrobacter phage Stayer]QFG12674.1 hypothetical protein PBI_MICHELLE_80 [Arthrobacter phage Michelle]QFG14447.1 hypothetical protein PBI_STARLORD_80 [Arthrobacter phage StarLord]WAB09496.1 hypothetical protein SEA_SLOOPYJOE_80 [Arthrobacter phage Sloopyjoe]
MAELKDVFESLYSRLAKDVDKQLIAFFGSEADLRRFGHLYVFEETPMQIETMFEPGLNGDHFGVRAESRWRIRPKTPEELREQEKD